ncbi:hypothetical protein [Vibrio genomosp. F10]|uniref:hypothetical protein n=1 Tax=Vibrio genomosp. F10 TaxID=723171 RepID=UPI0011123A6A|nr:hypothetical protein [Vibrio genomosp. F10]
MKSFKVKARSVFVATLFYWQRFLALLDRMTLMFKLGRFVWPSQMQGSALSKFYKCRAVVLITKACANNQHLMAKPPTNKLIKWTVKRWAFSAWSLIGTENSVVTATY